MPRFDFAQGVRFETIDEIIGLDAETFTPAHLDKGAGAVFIRELDAEFFTGGR